MTGKQLKNSILQWAIQGKLVPQDPNDEPASVLLERIRAEKARLVKEKKIKKDKNESIIFRGEDNSYYEKMADGTVRCIDSEIPFDIPDSWEWERWGNISFSIQYGYNAPAIENGDVKMVRISDIQDNQVLWQRVPFCKIASHEIPNYLLKPNDILFARTGGTVGKSFLVEQVPINAIYAGYLIRTRYSNELCPIYLKSFMESSLYWEQIRLGTIATAQPNCNGRTLGRMLLPVPPKDEQKRIALKITELRPLIEHYGTITSSLKNLNDSVNETLKKSILQEAIQGRLVPQIASEGTAEELLAEIRAEKQQLVKEGKLKKSVIANESRIFRGVDNRYYEQVGETITEIDVPFELPNNWVFTRLGHLCQLTDGDKREGIEVSLDAKYLRGKGISHIAKGRYIEKGERLILVDGENSGEVFTAPIAGYLGSTFKKLWIASSMQQNFVLLFLRLYKELLRNSKKGAAIPHLNKELFYSLIIGIPPLTEQVRIIKKADKLFEYIK